MSSGRSCANAFSHASVVPQSDPPLTVSLPKPSRSRAGLRFHRGENCESRPETTGLDGTCRSTVIGRSRSAHFSARCRGPCDRTRTAPFPARSAKMACGSGGETRRWMITGALWLYLGRTTPADVGDEHRQEQDSTRHQQNHEPKSISSVIDHGQRYQLTMHVPYPFACVAVRDVSHRAEALMFHRRVADRPRTTCLPRPDATTRNVFVSMASGDLLGAGIRPACDCTRRKLVPIRRRRPKLIPHRRARRRRPKPIWISGGRIS